LLQEVRRNVKLIAIRDIDASLVKEGDSGLLFEERAKGGVASKVFKFRRILEDRNMILMGGPKGLVSRKVII